MKKIKPNVVYRTRDDLVPGKIYGTILYSETIKTENIIFDEIGTNGDFGSKFYIYSKEMLERVKWFPIETAPLGKEILVWNRKTRMWLDFNFANPTELRWFLECTSDHTHWRYQPKGPK